MTLISYHSTISHDGSQRERLMGLLGDGEVWRMRELLAAGITSATVRRAVSAGTVVAVSRGIYRKAGAPSIRGERLAEISARVPNVVICLFSAAEFHGLANYPLHEVWGAVPNSQTAPRLERATFRPVRWRASAALQVGVQTERICGVDVRITDPARTVVDMLRMTSTVGEDRALDCLRAYAQERHPVDQLRSIAEALKVSKRLSQYLRAYTHIVRPP